MSDPEYKIPVCFWKPKETKGHTLRYGKVNRASTAAARLTEMLATPEWRGSDPEHVDHWFGKSKTPSPAIRLRHPSGAVCFLRLEP